MRRRAAMVREQIEAVAAWRDARMLQAMRELPRETLRAPRLEAEAYDDNPLPIAAGPDHLAALHRRLHERGAVQKWRRARVLEIGTGSASAAAVPAAGEGGAHGGSATPCSPTVRRQC